MTRRASRDATELPEVPVRRGERNSPTIVQVSVSRGGVPKLAVPEARVSWLGLDGDFHRDGEHHGGPERAVCLYVFGFFNLSESARRIRLLIELDAAGPRGLTLTETLAAYNAAMIVEARLARLVTGGQIEERAGRYVIKRRTALVVARGLGLVKLLFLGAPSALARRPSSSA